MDKPKRGLIFFRILGMALKRKKKIEKTNEEMTNKELDKRHEEVMGPKRGNEKED